MPSKTDRIVLRSPWPWGVWTIGLVCLLTGISPLLVVGEMLSTILVTGILMGLPGLYLTLRCPFVRVVVDSVGVHYHGYFARRLRPWSAIAAVRVVEVDGAAGSAYTPALVLADKPDEDEPLTALSGYTSESRLPWSRMAHQHRLIAERLELARTGDGSR